MSGIAALRITRLPDSKWLVVNPTNATAFKINDAAHAVLEAIRSDNDLDTAYEASFLKNEITKEDFNKAAHMIEERLSQSQSERIAEMSWGIWLVSPTVMRAVGQHFTWLLSGWVFWLNAALTISLVAALQTSTIGPKPLHFTSSLTGSALAILSVVFHEIGHCAALLRNNRVVGRMGVGITIIFPAFFTNVLEHEVMSRREKLQVDAAGVYFQLVFTNVLLLAGVATGSANFVGAAAIILTLGAIQLLPIGTLDGYWLLKDILADRYQWVHKWLIAISYGVITVLLARLVNVVLIPFWTDIFKGGGVTEGAFVASLPRVFSGLLGTLVCTVWTVSFAKRIPARIARSGQAWLPLLKPRINGSLKSNEQRKDCN